MTAISHVVATGRAIWTLLAELFFGGRKIGKERLSVRFKGVDKTLLFSRRASDGLRAFVDGSRLQTAECGFAVFYAEGHPMNSYGRIVTGSNNSPSSDEDAAETTTSSNLAELAAIFWCLLCHPRGQQLDIWSDSIFALNVIRSASEEAAPSEEPTSSDAKPGSNNKSRKQLKAAQAAAAIARCPALTPREQSLARAVWWLLRLRTAQTSFFKVPAHKGFLQNTFADALARQGAKDGPDCPTIPLDASLIRLAKLLFSYLVGQSELDGGIGDVVEVAHDASGGGSKTRSHHLNLRKPKPIGPSKEVTNLIALDCEMVGVGAFGSKSVLASVSIINEDGNEIYFSYAKPPRPVADYRTKWSGIERKHLVDAPPAKQVQQEVRKVCEGKIVVGHSLENDFRVLGFSPPREMMRDTAHDVRRLLSRAGRPRKLRHITWEFLGLVIQEKDGGHDPHEDALAALLLYRRYKEDFEARAAHHAAEARARREAAAASGGMKAEGKDA